MNATSDERSAADLEREGEQIRASLDRTLDEIQQRLSPAELMDRSMEFVRENGMDLLREAADTVRRNPVPIALTAAGLVWLVASVARSRSSEDVGGEGQDLSRYRAQSGRGYSRYGRDPDDYRGDYRTDFEREDWDATAHGRVRNAAHEMRRKVEGGVSRSMRTVQSYTRDGGSRLGDLVREQPVALGALALAAGALLGAALPTTRYENKYVGPVHDRTMARAKEAGKREYENLRQAVKSSQARMQRGPDEPRETH
ncbi:MAG TPA: DUF3618 domain-containing protein [Steroidobacter sp.]|uniref:DUF3618 domain-containing protein n=1 Tax=Steroidobacter sp. TaxID=1978227 RepID=UPI002EDB3702